MAFFKFRWPGSKEQPDKPAGKRSRNAQAESIEAMRRRARHRLIGAAVLVLLGVVGFPILFDTQPRPIPVDIPIDIPDRNKVAPLVVPEAAPARPSAPAPAPAMASAGGLAEGEEVVPSSRNAPKPAASAPVHAPAPAPAAASRPEVRAEPKPAPRPEPKPQVHESKPEPKPEPKPEAKPQRSEDAARARALLEGRDTPAPAAVASKSEEGRLIVQVGAFADADKAREVRQSLERAGLKTYTQVVDTKDGKRTRVRVGPYASRAEADKAAARVKGLGLSASVLAL